MTELLARIEALLTETTERQTAIPEVGSEPTASKSHPLTSWTSGRIVGALVEELPQWKSVREQEALIALKQGKYSRCRMYLRLVEGNAYIEAVSVISTIPAAFASSNSAELSSAFSQSIRAIDEVNQQAVAEMKEDDYAIHRASSVVERLEKLAIDIFAKGLGDEDEP